MSKILKGIVASRGVVIGPAKVFIKEKAKVAKTSIQDQLIETEKDLLKSAFDRYEKDLRDELDKESSMSDTVKEVIQVQIELLIDPYFMETALNKIENYKINGEWAVKETVDEMVAMIDIIEDNYLRERAADYRHIGMNLLYILQNIEPDTLSHLDQDYIIISDELTPSDTSHMDKKHILGFANDLGGRTSHVSIIAQTLGIPSLVGMKNVTQHVEDGDLVILDAENEQLIVNPTQEELNYYRGIIRDLDEEKLRLEEVKDIQVVTKDDVALEVNCNIDTAEDISMGLENGADGVGLFRTEFLYMKTSYFPSEEDQFNEYKKAVEQLNGKPLTIRTLDIGADKPLPYADFPNEENPFLGWRAIRISFDYPEMFDAQLRAMLRASAYGKVKILIPLVISVEEIIAVQDRIAELKEDLDAEGLAYDKDIEVGIMIETPSSVIIANELIKHCDFFSIGTNDLTQYMLAVDRGNSKINQLYDTYHPSVLRSIKMVIDAAKNAGKKVAMCGGFAGDSDATYLLLGMGLDEFSCPSSKIAKVKSILLRSTQSEAEDFANRVLASSSLEDICKLVDDNPNK